MLPDGSSVGETDLGSHLPITWMCIPRKPGAITPVAIYLMMVVT